MKFMVRMETKTITEFVCEKCGNSYTTEKQAMECEKGPVFPFQFETGMHVIFKGYDMDSMGIIIKTGVMTNRSIHGLGRSKWGHHCNLYNIKIDNSVFNQTIPEQDITGVILNTKTTEA